MKQYLFSYGTLQKTDVQIELFGRLLRGSKDVLRGYKVVSILLENEKQYHVIAAKAGEDDSISGTVMEITSPELSISDKYEPAEYKRVKLILQSGKEAWVYVTSENH